jgi:hypothetical protein
MRSGCVGCGVTLAPYAQTCVNTTANRSAINDRLVELTFKIRKGVILEKYYFT